MAAAKKKVKEYTIQMKRDKIGKSAANRFKVPPGSGEPPACENVYLPKWACGDAEEIEVVIRIPQ